MTRISHACSINVAISSISPWSFSPRNLNPQHYQRYAAILIRRLRWVAIVEYASDSACWRLMRCDVVQWPCSKSTREPSDPKASQSLDASSRSDTHLQQHRQAPWTVCYYRSKNKHHCLISSATRLPTSKGWKPSVQSTCVPRRVCVCVCVCLCDTALPFGRHFGLVWFILRSCRYDDACYGSQM